VIVFVDTSALIALVDEDDLHHVEAAAQFRWLARNATLVTHNYVQVETLAVAARNLGRGAVIRLADSIFPMLRVVWVDEQTHAAALAVYRSGGRASLVDRVSFAVMRSSSLEIAFAFDSDFAVEGFGQPSVPNETPRQVHDGSIAYGTATISDPVSVAEISARAGTSVNTVQSWRRRHSDFPVPLAQLATGPIWSWSAVADWIGTRPTRRVAGQA
jgi:predicted nucleic acid-binding protein